MTTTRSRQPLVLQGYFHAERFRGTARQARAIQPLGQGDWAAKAPRPELMPARTRGGAVQARRAAGPGASWPGAPRPDLLPGMGTPRGVVQPRASHGVSTVPIAAGQLRVIGNGRPLEPGIRQAMETFFQVDFSGVRVHEGPAAPAMGALAFTLGEEIHFAPGLYDPGSREGVALLGHELTHVVQQRDGRVANPYGQGIAIVQDPALEAEADRMGQQIADELWSDPRVGQPMTMAGRPPSAAMTARAMQGTMAPTKGPMLVRPAAPNRPASSVAARSSGSIQRMFWPSGYGGYGAHGGYGAYGGYAPPPTTGDLEAAVQAGKDHRLVVNRFGGFNPWSSRNFPGFNIEFDMDYTDVHGNVWNMIVHVKYNARRWWGDEPYAMSLKFADQTTLENPTAQYHPGLFTILAGTARQVIANQLAWNWMHSRGYTRVTAGIIQHLTGTGNREVLAALVKSDHYPLSVWDQAAWELYLDWVAR